MKRYNLLDERFIRVIEEKSGEVIEVSLITFFKNASSYKKLAGEMQTQDFAIFRFLLSVLHTVFSRFDVDGDAYEYIDIDEKYRQIADVDEDDLEEYSDDLMRTWENLWTKGKFPEILFDYLEKWRESFYFFSDENPFYQVTKEEMQYHVQKGKSPSATYGKTLNRLVSESNNKVALFSPKIDAKDNKSILSEAEAVRWTIMFQGYTGQSDKTKLHDGNYDVSKGFIYDIGGIFFEGKTVFETLLYNLMLVHAYDERYILNKQKPCWEYSGNENIELSFKPVDNLASLYTNWSRAIYINPDIDVSKKFEIEIAKMPNIEHCDNFLESMTLWKINKSGPNKDRYTPRKHNIGESLWRSFGLISARNEKNVPITAILNWYDKISKITNTNRCVIKAISMQDDGNATSWVPTNEIVDDLKIHNILLFDTGDDSWNIRINQVVEDTKKIIEFVYKIFLKDIKEIRNYSNDSFVDKKIVEFYYSIDDKFRQWIWSINTDTKKDDAIIVWKKQLKKELVKSAQKIVEEGGIRDFKGILKDEKVKNVPIVFNYFLARLNKEIC